jgi:steroid 5-alpha reductase family enzyme
MPFAEILFLLAFNLAAVLVTGAALWLVSVRIRNAGIVDIFWGPFCALPGVLTYFLIDGASPRDAILAGLVALWALRLALHLGQRNFGHDEDYRYAAMRKKQGSDTAFARWSLIYVFLLQPVIAWTISLPVQLGQLGPDKPLGAVAMFGVVVFAVGLAFEAIGDAQLKAFKSDAANKGKLMTKGLWAWTRHPNYFGDACVWFGLAVIALESPLGWIGLISPFVMAHFLINVSGKALLERGMTKKYPEYEAYKQSTSGFFPLPPKKS